MAERGDPQRPERDSIIVGRVIRPHGVRGETVVESLSDNPQRFAAGSRLRLAFDEDREPAVLVVERARPHRDRLLVVFEEVRDRDAANALRGGWLEVGPEEVPAKPDQVYYFQLLGCECFDRAAGRLGMIVDLEEDGGGLLLVIEGDGRRIPVPYVQEFIRDLDIAGRRLDLDLPEGLLELCAFES